MSTPIPITATFREHCHHAGQEDFSRQVHPPEAIWRGPHLLGRGSRGLNDAFARRVSQQVSADIGDVSIRVGPRPMPKPVLIGLENWSQERAQKEIIDAYVSVLLDQDRSRDPVETEIFRLARVAVEDAMDKTRRRSRSRCEEPQGSRSRRYQLCEAPEDCRKNINTPLVAVNLATPKPRSGVPSATG